MFSAFSLIFMEIHVCLHQGQIIILTKANWWVASMLEMLQPVNNSEQCIMSPYVPDGQQLHCLHRQTQLSQLSFTSPSLPLTSPHALVLYPCTTLTQSEKDHVSIEKHIRPNQLVQLKKGTSIGKKNVYRKVMVTVKDTFYLLFGQDSIQWSGCMVWPLCHQIKTLESDIKNKSVLLQRCV